MINKEGLFEQVTLNLGFPNRSKGCFRSSDTFVLDVLGEGVAIGAQGEARKP